MEQEIETEKIGSQEGQTTEPRAFTKEEYDAEKEANKIDVDKFIGKETTIVNYEEGTKEFEKGRISHYVRFVSDVLDHLNSGKELRASKTVGLQMNSEGVLGWYPGSKMANFLARLGVDHYSKAVGKQIRVTAQDAKDGNRYLTF